MPRRLVRDKLVVRGADLRYAGLQHLVSSGRCRTYVSDVASLDLWRTWAGTTEDRRELWAEIVDDAGGERVSGLVDDIGRQDPSVREARRSREQRRRRPVGAAVAGDGRTQRE